MDKLNNKEDTMADKTIIEQRFYNRVHKTPDCWLWIGDNSGSPYGRFQMNSVRIFAHRLSYMLNRGSIMPGQVINHVCMNKRCVNPAHLEAVTPRQNSIHYQDNRQFNYYGGIL